MKHCYNCHQSLEQSDQFCNRCGQKVQSLHQPLWHYLQNFVSDVFSLDGKLFRTLLHLCVPAKLAKNYIAGQRQRYFHPLRLLIVLFSIFTLLFLSLNFDQKSEDLVFYDEINSKLKEDKAKIDALYTTKSQEVAIYSLQLDSILAASDSIKFQPVFSLSESKKAAQQRFPNIAIHDLANLPPKKIAAKYGITNLWRKIELTGFRNFVLNVRAAIINIIRNFIWVMLLVLPLLAALLRMMFKTDYPYITQHLTFISLLFSFYFFVKSFGILFSHFTGFNVFTLTLIATHTYIILSIHQFYGIRWWKTLLLYFFGLLLLTAIAFFGIIALVLVSGYWQ